MTINPILSGLARCVYRSARRSKGSASYRGRSCDRTAPRSETHIQDNPTIRLSVLLVMCILAKGLFADRIHCLAALQIVLHPLHILLGHFLIHHVDLGGILQFLDLSFDEIRDCPCVLGDLDTGIFTECDRELIGGDVSFWTGCQLYYLSRICVKGRTHHSDSTRIDPLS